ncbi:cation:proton antiporter [Pseudarthrobacter sp. J1763]|uniref:cation:proton antiporter n=1 Tax=Pseudarthrobacter sp. J1763 TaxID=3420445 RepID=UPI003D2B9E9A
MTFFTLALISAVALLGPLLTLPKRWNIPVVLGQLLAGLVIGRSGLAWVDSAEPTFTWLADIGFALMMFVAGSHLPLRNLDIRGVLKKGAIQAIVAAVGAGALGVLIAAVFGTGHAPLYIVLLASSSAALVLPIIYSMKLQGPNILALTAQVAVADIACIVALPLAIDPDNAVRAAAGALVVAACSALLFVLLRHWEQRGTRLLVHRLSERHGLALELRIQLMLLFALAGIAAYGHVSVLLAGFSFGLVVAAVGEPRRLAHQLFALSDGFLGPLFFVWLGASLNLRELWDHPTMIALGLALGAGAVLVHCLNFLLHQGIPLGVLAATQLGVPVAAATVGNQLGVLQPGEPAALVLGALVTIAAAAIAGSRLASKQRKSSATNPAT